MVKKFNKAVINNDQNSCNEASIIMGKHVIKLVFIMRKKKRCNKAIIINNVQKGCSKASIIMFPKSCNKASVSAANA